MPKTVTIPEPHSVKEKLFNDESTSDVQIIYRNTTFLLHKCLLSKGSLYFAKCFASSFAESNSHIVDFSDSLNVDIECFTLFLQYFYGESLGAVDCSTFISLIQLTDYFHCSELENSLFWVIQDLKDVRWILQIFEASTYLRSFKWFSEDNTVEDHFRKVFENFALAPPPQNLSDPVPLLKDTFVFVSDYASSVMNDYLLQCLPISCTHYGWEP
ncbi:hypothetical protein P9112_003560 [Eukaryota sp. TZLM1-RC]